MIDATAIIMTKNEEKNIVDCLQSMKGFAKRCVVIDCGSTDETVRLAKENGFVTEHFITASLINNRGDVVAIPLHTVKLVFKAGNGCVFLLGLAILKGNFNVKTTVGRESDVDSEERTSQGIEPLRLVFTAQVVRDRVFFALKVPLLPKIGGKVGGIRDLKVMGI